MPICVWKRVSIVHVKGPLFTTFKNSALLRPTAEPLFLRGSPRGRFPPGDVSEAPPVSAVHAAGRLLLGNCSQRESSPFASPERGGVSESYGGVLKGKTAVLHYSLFTIIAPRQAAIPHPKYAWISAFFALTVPWIISSEPPPLPFRAALNVLAHARSFSFAEPMIYL